ncbi:MAG: PilT/PilU family type 4a pilus ATPase [Ottowia sp.]|nr:PilT/PilU family type 4a pilus ATPase [Ottowia sp.]
MSTEQSPMKRVLQLMADKNASDVYLSPGSPVTVRIEGHCVPVNNQLLPSDGPLRLLSEIVTPAQLEELQSRGELNVAVALQGLGSFRISGMRQRGSYAVVIRYISFAIPRISTLKLPRILENLIMEKRGLILMVGATGTGKSTTLASLIDYRNERVGGHILTMEDPIEFRFSNKKSIINQRQVGSDTESLEIGLKNGLRQAPDVIMIGEIRDRETMAAAIMYAQTGHLCLATLHANNSYHALNRILSFYPLETRAALLGDMAAALKAIISQRLIPGVDGKRLPAAEVLLNTKLISELIEKSDFSGVRDAMEKAMAEGSQTFEQDLARLIHTQQISREAGMAFADSPTNLMWRLQNTEPQKTDTRQVEQEASSEPTFADLTLDVQASEYASSNFSKSRSSGFAPSVPGSFQDSRIGDAGPYAS